MCQMLFRSLKSACHCPGTEPAKYWVSKKTSHIPSTCWKAKKGHIESVPEKSSCCGWMAFVGCPTLLQITGVTISVRWFSLGHEGAFSFLCSPSFSCRKRHESCRNAGSLKSTHISLKQQIEQIHGFPTFNGHDLPTQH